MDYSTDHWLGPWLKRTYRHMTNIHDKKLSKYNLTTSQVSVLSQLWLKDGQTQKELIEKLGIRAASLTGIVDGLVKREWVIRKADNVDARIKRLYLTEAGKNLEDICLKVVKEMEDILKQGFSEEELTILRIWLERLHSNVTKPA